MCQKCFWVFLAGAAAMHTVGHIALNFANLLPLHVWGFTLTQNLNYIIIGGSAVLTGLFLYLASNCECECKVR